MKLITSPIVAAFLLLFGTAAHAQTPSWQWGSSGGAASSSGPNGEDNVIDMATDPNGNVYVLANNNQGTGIKVDGQPVGVGPWDRVSIAKWNCQGDLKWVKTFGGGAQLTASALKTDTLGGVYVIGVVANESSVPGPAGYAYFDTDTTLPVTNKSMYLIKYDTSGAFQWLNMPQADTVSINSFSYCRFNDMYVNPEGIVYAFCNLAPGAYNDGNYIVTTQSNHVLKYNKDGLFLGGTAMDVHTSGGSGGGDLVNVQRAHFSRDNHSGRYYLAGYYWPDFGTLRFGTTTINGTGGILGYPMYLAAFDSNGDNLWVKQSDPDKGCGVFSRPVIDNFGNVYIGGSAQPTATFGGYTFTNNNGPYGVPFIIAVDSNGNNIWASNAMTVAVSKVMAITYINNIIAASGYYAGPLQWDSLGATSAAGLTYIFLNRSNATTGALIGLDTIASNNLHTYATSIAADKNNNFYVGGQFGNELYPGGDTLHNWGGMYDWFVAKFGSANCNCDIPQPNFSYNTTGSNTYAFNYTGSTPYTGISWDFGDGAPASSGNANPVHTYAASGTYHVCVTVTNNCGSNTYCKTINIDGTGIQEIPGFANILIYPNPATQEIVIEQAAAGTALDIYNVTGSRLLHRVLKGSKDRINVGNLPSGIYLMRFTDKEGHQGSHKFVKR